MPKSFRTTKQDNFLNLKSLVTQNATNISGNTTNITSNSTNISNIGQVILSGTAANSVDTKVYIPVSGHTPCNDDTDLKNWVRLSRSGTFKTLILTKSTGGQDITVSVDKCTALVPTGADDYSIRTWTVEPYTAYSLFTEAVTTVGTGAAITFSAGDYVRVSIQDDNVAPSIVQATLLQWVNLSS